MALFKRKDDTSENLGTSPMTESIDAIISALTSGAAEQQLAAKRLSGITDQIIALEAERRESARLTIELSRLTDQLEELEVKSQSHAAWAAEQSAKYKATKEERDLLRRDLDENIAKLAKARDTIELHEKEIRKLAVESGVYRDQETRERERADLAEHERSRLSDAVSKRDATVQSQSTKITELERSVDDLNTRLSEKSAKAEASGVSLREARVEQAANKEKLIEALNALQAAEYRLTRQEGSHKDAMRRRDEEVTALRRQLEQYEADLTVKAGMSRDYDRDMADMRKTLQAEKERGAMLDLRLREAAETEERQAAAIAKATLDHDNLLSKFSDALLDVEALRKVNLMQKKTLDRYAEIGGSPLPKSHTSPEPTRPVRIVSNNDKMVG